VEVFDANGVSFVSVTQIVERLMASDGSSASAEALRRTRWMRGDRDRLVPGHHLL
jgi:hypothetical protein